MYNAMPWGNSLAPQPGTIEHYQWMLNDKQACLAYLIDHNPIEDRHPYAQYEIDDCQSQIEYYKKRIAEMSGNNG